MPIESLENRRMLSFALSAGLLTVTGSGGDDSITLKLLGSQIKLSDNGQTAQFAQNAITAIAITAGGGDDLVTIEDAVKPSATIKGQAGDDTIRGGGGKDLIDGGDGADDMAGGGNKDTVDYSSRVNPISVGLGSIADDGEANEHDNARNDIETILGGQGSDTLLGAGPANLIIGNGGDDYISGSGGNDTMDGGAGADTMYGGSGNDTVTYASRTNPVSVTADSIADDDGEAGEHDKVGGDVETIIGGAGADSITGNSKNNLLLGGDANDTLDGVGGDDTLDGQAGADSMIGGSGSDTVTYASRTAKVVAAPNDSGASGETGEGDEITSSIETIIGGSGPDILSGDSGGPNISNLLLRGGDGDDTITGGTLDDTLLGEGGDDSFSEQGSPSAAVIDNGQGADVMDGGSGKNSMSFSSPFVQDPIYVNLLDGLPNDGRPGEGDNITHMTVLVGSDGNDTLIGDNSDNDLESGGGTDNLLIGNGGNDAIDFGVGVAANFFGSGTAFGGDGNDTFHAGALGAGAREIHGGNGDDRMMLTGNAQIVTGDAGNDYANYQAVFHARPTVIDVSNASIETIIGTNRDDSIIGGDGNEVILGEAGSDTIFGNGGDDYIDGGDLPDHLFGGDGNDIFVNADGGAADKVDGGDGFDIAQDDGLLVSDPVQIPNDSLTNIEFIYDPNSGDALPGPAARLAAPLGSLLVASAANLADGVLTINGTSAGDGISVILDSTGNNINVTLNGTSQVFVLGSVNSIFIDSGGGNDTIACQKSDGTRAIKVPTTIAGGSGNDSILGGAGRDSIAGGTGNDTINGSGGNDRLNGGNDASTSSPDGADSISGGIGEDAVFYSQRQDNLNIDISVGSKKNDGAPGEGDSVQTDIEDIFSGNGNDNIVGNISSNIISGGGGDDTIKAGDGNDKLIGSRGADVIMGEKGINLYSILDGGADQFDGTLSDTGAPVNCFVSGDSGLDFSTVSGRTLL